MTCPFCHGELHPTHPFFGALLSCVPCHKLFDSDLVEQRPLNVRSAVCPECSVRELVVINDRPTRCLNCLYRPEAH